MKDDGLLHTPYAFADSCAEEKGPPFTCPESSYAAHLQRTRARISAQVSDILLHVSKCFHHMRPNKQHMTQALGAILLCGPFVTNKGTNAKGTSPSPCRVINRSDATQRSTVGTSVVRVGGG